MSVMPNLIESVCNILCYCYFMKSSLYHRFTKVNTMNASFKDRQRWFRVHVHLVLNFL